MVEFSPATREARVRFPAGAIIFSPKNLVFFLVAFSFFLLFWLFLSFRLKRFFAWKMNEEEERNS